MKSREPVCLPQAASPAVPAPVPPAPTPSVQRPPPRAAETAPDMLLPPAKSPPLPQGAAMDLLYENRKPDPKGSGADEVCEPPRKRPRQRPRAPVPAPLPPVRAAEPEPLVDSGDKLHRVAVVADVFIDPLRPPRLGRSALVPALRPKSKAECERRCGSDGFCDPSSPIGCGGIFCGRPREPDARRG